MLNQTLRDEIRTTTQEFWNAEVQTLAFSTMAAGKEIGHRIADKVDEQTTQLLRGTYPLFFEHGPKGQRARSMGDFWLLSEGIYHPVNVKAGIVKAKGNVVKSSRPNIVSLRRLLNGLLKSEFDAYYLLIIQFILGQETRAEVCFVDILDYLEYVDFNAGPGQLMLKQKEFYVALNNNQPPPILTLSEKGDKLIEKWTKGYEDLIAARTKTHETILASGTKQASDDKDVLRLIQDAQSKLNLR